MANHATKASMTAAPNRTPRPKPDRKPRDMAVVVYRSW
jgi:hypothetical protein